MAQSQGINTKVGYVKETAFRRVPAAVTFRQLYFESEGLGSNFNMISSNIIRTGANPIMPSRGNQDGKIQVVTTLSPQLASLINPHVLGNNVTTGAGPYTHTGKIAALNSIMFEKGVTDNNLYLVYMGGKFTALTLDFPSEGPIKATFDGANCAECLILPYDAQSGNFAVGNVVSGGTSGANALIIDDIDSGTTGTLVVTGISGTFADNETLTDGAIGSATSNIPNGVAYASLNSSYTDPSHTPWDAYEITLMQEGGATSLLNVQSAQIKIERDIDTGSYTVGGRGTRGALPEGRAKISGTVTCLFDAQAVALFHKAIRFQETSLKIACQHGTGAGTAGNESFELDINELKWGKQTPVVTGPKGMISAIPFEAYYDNDAAASAAVCIFKTSQATL